ncbi:hypothetical protein PSPO01_16096 [Paraphaeosphaeria sporulosa]
MTRPSNAATVISLRHNTKATTEPKHLPIAVTIHNIQLLMGFLVSPSPTDNVCDVPHRRALGLNGITSHTNHLTYTRHATIGATQYSSHRQPRPLSPLSCVERVVPLDTRQGLEKFARELSYSVDLTARSNGALLSWGCVVTECYCRCARWQVTPQNTVT